MSSLRITVPAVLPAAGFAQLTAWIGTFQRGAAAGGTPDEQSNLYAPMHLSLIWENFDPPHFLDPPLEKGGKAAVVALASR